VCSIDVACMLRLDSTETLYAGLNRYKQVFPKEKVCSGPGASMRTSSYSVRVRTVKKVSSVGSPVVIEETIRGRAQLGGRQHH